MIKRFIWDLDGTLLDNDFHLNDNFFNLKLPQEEAKLFLDRKRELLYEYETTYPYYDEELLSEFLTRKTSVNISPKMIYEWLEYSRNIPDKVHDGVFEVLSYLQSKKIENVVCSNWFQNTQVNRLKQAGLLNYFKEVYSGDYSLKPNRAIYMAACGPYKADECVMVGDNLVNDVLVPSKMGIHTIYYNDKDEKVDVDVEHRVKTLRKIKEMY